MCIGEEVAGGDATDRLMDVRGCDVSWSSAKRKPYINILNFGGEGGTEYLSSDLYDSL